MLRPGDRAQGELLGCFSGAAWADEENGREGVGCGAVDYEMED